MSVARSSAVLFMVALAPAAWPCDCSRLMTESQAVLVFEGTTTAKSIWTQEGDETGTDRVTFEVARTLKGPKLSYIVIDTHRSDCGIPFQLGERWRVVATSYPKAGIQWWADACGPSKKLAAPKERKVP
jgi:hypothetical protein